MINILKKLYRLYRIPTNWSAFYFRQFFYFVYPNRIKLFLKQIVYEKMPSINQFTVCDGSGIVEIGNNCTFGYETGGFNRCGSIELQAKDKNARIKIGNNVFTNNNILLIAANYIEIGDDTLIGQNVIILDHDAHGTDPSKRRLIGDIGNVIIGKNVWIGNNVTILKNSKIGDNSIVAAGAVVAGEFPANVIIGGVPAKFIKKL